MGEVSLKGHFQREGRWLNEEGTRSHRVRLEQCRAAPSFLPLSLILSLSFLLSFSLSLSHLFFPLSLTPSLHWFMGVLLWERGAYRLTSARTTGYVSPIQGQSQQPSVQGIQKTGWFRRSKRMDGGRSNLSPRKCSTSRFCRSQLPHKPVNLFFTMTSTMHMLMNLCGIRLL